MRSRNIKPGFFKNDLLAECDPLARILFAGLWCFADREGRFDWRPRRIQAEILPYDHGADIDSLLSELEQRGFIQSYVVDNIKYGLIPRFLQHQKPHRNEAQSKIPPDGHAKDIPRTSHNMIKDEPTTGQGGLNEERGMMKEDSLTLNPSEDAKELCEYWIKLVQESDPKAKLSENDLGLVAEFRETESDRTLDEIKRVMRFGREDDNFWKARIPRLGKFIEHFNSLAQQALEVPRRKYRLLE